MIWRRWHFCFSSLLMASHLAQASDVSSAPEPSFFIDKHQPHEEAKALLSDAHSSSNLSPQAIMQNTITIDCPPELLLGLHLNTEGFADYVKRQSAINLFKEGKFSCGTTVRCGASVEWKFCGWHSMRARPCWKTPPTTCPAQPR